MSENYIMRTYGMDVWEGMEVRGKVGEAQYKGRVISCDDNYIRVRWEGMRRLAIHHPNDFVVTSGVLILVVSAAAPVMDEEESIQGEAYPGECPYDGGSSIGRCGYPGVLEVGGEVVVCAVGHRIAREVWNCPRKMPMLPMPPVLSEAERWRKADKILWGALGEAGRRILEECPGFSLVMKAVKISKGKLGAQVYLRGPGKRDELVYVGEEEG